MTDTYTTVQGDTWDLISYKLYGDEKYMKYLIEANWPLLDVLVFSSGTVLDLPDIPEDADEDTPFWRSEDEDDEDDESYSSTEDTDDE